MSSRKFPAIFLCILVTQASAGLISSYGGSYPLSSGFSYSSNPLSSLGYSSDLGYSSSPLSSLSYSSNPLSSYGYSSDSLSDLSSYPLSTYSSSLLSPSSYSSAIAPYSSSYSFSSPSSSYSSFPLTSSYSEDSLSNILLSMAPLLYKLIPSGQGWSSYMPYLFISGYPYLVRLIIKIIKYFIGIWGSVISPYASSYDYLPGSTDFLDISSPSSIISYFSSPLYSSFFYPTSSYGSSSSSAYLSILYVIYQLLQTIIGSVPSFYGGSYSTLSQLIQLVSQFLSGSGSSYGGGLSNSVYLGILYILYEIFQTLVSSMSSGGSNIYQLLQTIVGSVPSVYGGYYSTLSQLIQLVSQFLSGSGSSYGGGLSNSAYLGILYIVYEIFQTLVSSMSSGGSNIYQLLYRILTSGGGDISLLLLLVTVLYTLLESGGGIPYLVSSLPYLFSYASPLYYFGFGPQSGGSGLGPYLNGLASQLTQGGGWGGITSSILQQLTNYGGGGMGQMVDGTHHLIPFRIRKLIFDVLTQLRGPKDDGSGGTMHLIPFRIRKLILDALTQLRGPKFRTPKVKEPVRFDLRRVLQDIYHRIWHNVGRNPIPAILALLKNFGPLL